jgi:DNA polymerase elongation subunit (family B)
MDVSLLSVRYDDVARVNKGKWFALSRDGELIAVSSSERRLWSKIRRKLSGKEIDVVIGYSQTEEERKTACLLAFPLTNGV